MNNFSSGIFGFLAGALTLATIAVLVSKNAKTGEVFGAAAGGIAKVINAAVSPVTGNSGLNLQ